LRFETAAVVQKSKK